MRRYCRAAESFKSVYCTCDIGRQYGDARGQRRLFAIGLPESLRVLPRARLIQRQSIPYASLAPRLSMTNSASLSMRRNVRGLLPSLTASAYALLLAPSA